MKKNGAEVAVQTYNEMWGHYPTTPRPTIIPPNSSSPYSRLWRIGGLTDEPLTTFMEVYNFILSYYGRHNAVEFEERYEENIKDRTRELQPSSRA